jgi:hypothetical protein
MKRSGAADLPLHYGQVPKWLADRMSKLGFAIVEAVVTDYGADEVLRRMSDPFWFQSFGAVLGMDWHSSGITTSVMGALKRSVNPHSAALGIYICGGKGRSSRETPAELLRIAEQTGFDGHALVRSSKLSAKVDNNAVQDGFQLYLHNFILSNSGQWTVIQQGMNDTNGMARRYHWHSGALKSFIEDPHTAVCGINQGEILNLTDSLAAPSREGMLQVTGEKPEQVISEFQHLVMPSHHDVRAENVNLKKLGSTLWLAHEQQPKNFEELLLLEGVGPRTIQSLALVSEIIHGSPSRFRDPARFSFAHGGKDGHPFPVPVKAYDEVIDTLHTAVNKAKIGAADKNEAIKKLHQVAAAAEKNFVPNSNFEAVIGKERRESWKYGGRTVFGNASPPKTRKGVQLRLF